MSTIVTSGLIGYWNYNSGVTATTWEDLSGNGVTLTFAGTGTHAVASNGVTFNGVSDMASGTIPSSITTFTKEAWVTINDTSTYQTAISTPGDFVLACYSPVVAWCHANVELSTTVTLPTGTLAHIVATNDGTTSKLYVNGVFQNSMASSSLQPTNTDNISLGAYWYTSSKFYYFLSGTIAVARNYNIALTSSEITQNYNVGTAIGLTSSTILTITTDDGSISSGTSAVEALPSQSITSLGGSTSSGDAYVASLDKVDVSSGSTSGSDIRACLLAKLNVIGGSTSSSSSQESVIQKVNTISGDNSNGSSIVNSFISQSLLSSGGSASSGTSSSTYQKNLLINSGSTSTSVSSITAITTVETISGTSSFSSAKASLIQETMGYSGSISNGSSLINYYTSIYTSNGSYSVSSSDLTIKNSILPYSGNVSSSRTHLYYHVSIPASGGSLSESTTAVNSSFSVASSSGDISGSSCTVMVLTNTQTIYVTSGSLSYGKIIPNVLPNITPLSGNLSGSSLKVSYTTKIPIKSGSRSGESLSLHYSIYRDLLSGSISNGSTFLRNGSTQSVSSAGYSNGGSLVTITSYLQQAPAFNEIRAVTINSSSTLPCLYVSTDTYFYESRLVILSIKENRGFFT